MTHSDTPPRCSQALPGDAGTTLAIVTFFVLAFLWSWGIGLLAELCKDQSVVLATTLAVVAGFGPSLAGLTVVALFSNTKDLSAWFRGCLNWHIGARWLALAFLLPPAAMLCALGIHVFLGGTFPELPGAEKLPLVIANFPLVLLIGGPLGEEFGWRGYALPALARKLRWRWASILIGSFWGLWHLPLFYIANSAQSHMPMGLFMLNIIAGSVLFGRLAEGTQGSVISALLLHTSLNAWAGILRIIPTSETARPYALVTGLLLLAALVLLRLPQSRRSATPAAIRPGDLG